MALSRIAGLSRVHNATVVWVLTVLVIAVAGPMPAGAQDRIVPTSPGDLRLSYSPVVKAAAPAVVNVYASRTVRSRPISPMFNDPFFERFFGGRSFGLPQERVQNSLGSGVIVGADGIVVTNHHVIADADEVRVVLADRREFPAELLIKDERTDLAILRVDAGNEVLPVIEFATPDSLEVGDLVLAVGNPFGVGQTVTSGIVSALARTQVGITDFGFFIQTDAAINPGNSGGALVDMAGRLVGINTAIYSRSGGSVGIGFAIPSEMVRLVVASAGAGGVQRPWFGAQLQDVTSEIAEALGLDRPGGVLIADLWPDGPAASAGLARGDVVLSIDGQEVRDPSGFNYRFATRGVGGQATLTVMRNGREIIAPISLVPPPEVPDRDARRIEGPSPFAGALVANLSPALVDELGLSTMRAGVVIIDVGRRSPARSLGLQPGDIILEINGGRTATSADVVSLTRSAHRVWRLSIDRNGRTLNTVVGG